MKLRAFPMCLHFAGMEAGIRIVYPASSLLSRRRLFVNGQESEQRLALTPDRAFRAPPIERHVLVDAQTESQIDHIIMQSWGL
jgi:hypothetical protein